MPLVPVEFQYGVINPQMAQMYKSTSYAKAQNAFDDDPGLDENILGVWWGRSRLKLFALGRPNLFSMPK